MQVRWHLKESIVTSAQPAAPTLYPHRWQRYSLCLALAALALSGACADTPNGGPGDEEKHHVSDKTRPAKPSPEGHSRESASAPEPTTIDPATAAPVSTAAGNPKADTNIDANANANANAANVPQALLDTLSADLATHASVRPADIAVVQTQAVDWPDSALGCPQPGMGYMQVITPGYRVVLQASGRQFHYHTNQRVHFVLCKQPASSGRAVRPRDDT